MKKILLLSLLTATALTFSANAATMPADTGKAAAPAPAAGWVAARLCTARTRLHCMEAISGWTDHPDMDCNIVEQQDREGAAREFERFQPDVDGRQGVLPFGSRRPRDALLL